MCPSSASHRAPLQPPLIGRCGVHADMARVRMMRHSVQSAVLEDVDLLGVILAHANLTPERLVDMARVGTCRRHTRTVVEMRGGATGYSTSDRVTAAHPNPEANPEAAPEGRAPKAAVRAVAGDSDGDSGGSRHSLPRGVAEERHSTRRPLS